MKEENQMGYRYAFTTADGTTRYFRAPKMADARRYVEREYGAVGGVEKVTGERVYASGILRPAPVRP